VHLVGFTIEIYYDARPCGREIHFAASHQVQLFITAMNRRAVLAGAEALGRANQVRQVEWQKN